MKFRPQVLASSAYVPDWLGLDRHDYIRLDRNECTQAISPYVADAIARQVDQRGVSSYPEDAPLADALADYCGVPTDHLLATNGSDQGIDLCLRAFLGEGDTMLVARPEFSVFGHIAGLIGARIDGIPFDEDLRFPYDEFWAAAQRRPELIVVINPNNPTGTPVDLAYIERLAAGFPDIPVLVDEAYFEFTGQTVVGLIRHYPNLIVLRTFSKAFAMAGLRLGYVVAAPETIGQLRKLRNPFDVNELAVVAARAQLAHLGPVRAYVEDVMGHVKPLVVDFLKSLDEPFWPGVANFLLVKPRNNVNDAVEFLRSNGILVRTMGAPALAGTFRMSLGTEPEMREFMRVYGGALQ